MDNPIRNETIKVLTSARLIDYMTRRPTHLVTRMARSNKTINICSGSFLGRWRPGVVREAGWETRCFYRPPFTRFRPVARLSDAAYTRFVRRNIRPDDIVWAYEPFTIEAYVDAPRKLLVYEMCDDTAAYFANDPERYERTRRQEETVCRAADLVVTVSDTLLEKKRHINPNFHVVRNGADYELFSQARTLTRAAADELHGLRPPIVGYHGAVSPWIDYSLVREVALRLPKFTFVFIGRINPACAETVRELNRMPNVRFVGERRYADLVHFLKYYDVAIIPFVLDELMVSVNPIKMYEYLAGGRPVVSTPLPEVQLVREDGVVATASDAEDFARAVSGLAEGGADDERLVARRMAVAYENSWDVRYGEIERLAAEALGKK